MMNKKHTGAMAVSIILVIVAMILGLVIGFMVGRSYKAKDNLEETHEDVAIETVAETAPVIESESETETETESETESETEGSLDSEGGTIVMQVGDRKVGMDEVNARRYALRDYYIRTYGEDPWDTLVDNGMTAAEEAKEILRTDIIRAEIFMDKASDYGIVVTDDIKAMCEEEAQQRLDELGEEVATEFGITKEALTEINIKFSVITEVTNALSDSFRSQLAEDESTKDLSEAEREQKIAEMVKEQEKTWADEYEISYSEVWDHIVVGSVG